MIDPRVSERLADPDFMRRFEEYRAANPEFFPGGTTLEQQASYFILVDASHRQQTAERHQQFAALDKMVEARNAPTIETPETAGDRGRIPEYVYSVADKAGALTYHIDYMRYSDFLNSVFSIHNLKKTLFIYDAERGFFKVHTNEIETHVRETIKKHSLSDRLTTAIREVVSHVRSMGCVDKYPFIGPFGEINVKNGSLNLETGVLTPATPQMLYNYRIETPYRKFDETKELFEFLDQYGSREPIAVLAKAIWQRAYHDTLKEITIFYGPKDAGKTTCAELIQATCDGDLTSKSNVSRSLLHELLQRFGTADLEGKLVNYGDDLPDMFVKNSGRINSLVGSVNQHIEKKGIDGFDAVVTAYYLFSANNLPPLDDDDSVIWGKIHLVNYDKVITTARIPREKLFSQLIKEQLLFRAVQMALTWRESPYRNDQEADWVREKWHEASTDVDAFLIECVEYDPFGSCSLDEIKACYEIWCANNGKQRHVKYLNKKVQPSIRRESGRNVYTVKVAKLERKDPTKNGILPV